MAAIALKRGDSFSSNQSSDDGGFRGGAGGFLSRGNAPLTTGLYEKSYGPTLTSLEYKPQVPFRRHSLARDGSSSTMGDDLSLMGECDVSSTRSDRSQARPGRRASLSAAIELTRTAPPKYAEPPKMAGRKGRRNSLFGNSSKDNSSSNGGIIRDAAAEPVAARRSSSRRASMTGYPAAAAAEPEPTPQFFHKHKKDKSSRAVPDRKKTKSFDRSDKALGKIRRPGKGSRRASMSAMLTTKSNSKGSVNSKGSNRSLLSSSNSASSEYDLSDDGSNFAGGGGGGGGGGRKSATAFRAPMRHSIKPGDEIKLDLGYDDLGYDPQLPPPPEQASKPSRKSQFKIDRRGSTGTAMNSFPTNSAAQKSLKESLAWKKEKPPEKNVHRASIIASRRFSNAGSIAHSVATDLDLAHQRSPLDIPPPSRRGPSDVPPPRKGPADIPPPSRRGPSDIPPPSRRGPSDIPPPSTPTHAGKNTITIDDAPGTPMGSERTDEDDASYATPISSNRKVHGGALEKNMNLLGGLMNDDSSSSIDSGTSSGGGGAGFSMLGSRRASRGLSVLNKPAPPLRPKGRASAPLLGGPMLGASINPYGASKRDSDDEEDEDEGGGEDDEETEEDREQNRKMADFGSEAGDPVYMDSTTESLTEKALTLGTTTSTEQSSEDQEEEERMQLKEETLKGKDEKKKGKDKDDGSVDSMESEAPQEKAPVIDQHLEDIGATGDWSAGVADTTTNSILDKYPGSEMDYEGQDLGYGYGLQSNLLGYDDESERKDGDPDYEIEHGYGVSDLYDEDYSSFGWKEHPPRAAQSIEYINMEHLMNKAKTNKALYVPKFIPAHGCTNGSDFIVRAFVARLRAGVTVTKHSRSRFCKSHDRILHILPTGYHITWIPETEEEVVEKSKKKPPTKLDLTKCVEVRHAWSRDPKSKKYTGTQTLRAKCKEGAANRSFALIYPQRTVDFTAQTVDQCKLLMEGFSALCFRLQMARLEQQAGEEFTQNSGISGTLDHDDDSATASLTGTNMSAPWGL